MEKVIIYATRYGCTEECSKILSENISGNIELKNLNKNKDVDIGNYDLIIIGRSIIAGRINKEITNFCNDNLDDLLKKKVALFICCLREGKEAEEQFNKAFPEKLLGNALLKGYFGGKVSFEKLNFFFKNIMKNMLNTDKNVSNIKEENIKEFAKKVDGIK